MPHPIEKASELIDRINAMIFAAPGEDALRQLEHEISQVERAGCYSQAKQLQGMLAGIRGDADEVHRKFNAALMSSGNSSLVRENYAQALANLHRFGEAVEQIELAVEQAPDNLGLLLAAQEICENAYHVDRAEQLIEQIRRLGQEERISPEKATKLVRMRQLLEEAGATWMEVSARIELASSILLSLGARVSSITESFSESTALLEFNIRGDLDLAIRAEDAVHRAVADQPYSAADKMLAFTCVPE